MFMLDKAIEPSPVENTKHHKTICTTLNEIYLKKNTDYGDSFRNTYKKLGIISAVTRISDKYERLVTLSQTKDNKGLVSDESLKDTLLDLANYCIMTVMELEREEKQENPGERL